MEGQQQAIVLCNFWLKVELWESSNKVFFSQITQMTGIHHVNFSVRS